MMETEDLQLKYKPSKVCGICGDKALGYNFNAVTCEACKAFFRRNALRTKVNDFKCPFDGNCKIDLVTRRFCQKCRLKKCFDIGMKKEWILSDDEKKVKRDKIVENRRKKDHTGPSNPYNIDNYSSSSETYSPEMKPSMNGLNSDLLNSNYALSVSEGKGFLNSLYLLEQYQNQYQQYLSGKTPKEPMVPYSASIPKVPNHSAADLAALKVDSALRSPPPMATTSSSPMMDGYPGPIYPKGVEFGGEPFANNHLLNPIQTLHRTAVPNNINFHNTLREKQDLNMHQSARQLYSKYQPDPQIIDQTSSNSSDSSYQFNSFRHEQGGIGRRSRSESQIASADMTLNGKPEPAISNGSIASGMSRENDSADNLSSDEDITPKRASFTADRPDLNDDSDNVSEVSLVYHKSDIEMSVPRPVPTVKPSLSVYNFIEELRMQELTMACDLLKHWCQYSKIVHEMLEVNEMLSSVEIIIKKVIEMARMVTTFKELCEMEQIALLKGAVTEMIILRSVLNYVPEKDAWVFNLDEEHGEGQFLKYSTYESLVCKGFYVEVKQFMLDFLPDWKSDRTLFDLLTVIILFTPNRPNLKHKEIIKLEWLTYRHLLQRYLESKASKEVSRLMFSNLMDLLARLNCINEKVNKMYTFKVIESYKP